MRLEECKGNRQSIKRRGSERVKEDQRVKQVSKKGVKREKMHKTLSMGT